MANAICRPPPGCVHHTDRGSQYCAHDYQKLLRKHGFKVSMSGEGNCYDTSAAESFFKSLKAELVWRRNWQTRRDLDVALFPSHGLQATPLPRNGIHQRLLQPVSQTLGPRLAVTRGLRTQGRLT